MSQHIYIKLANQPSGWNGRVDIIGPSLKNKFDMICENENDSDLEPEYCIMACLRHD